jgi:hypothetical protein
MTLYCSVFSFDWETLLGQEVIEFSSDRNILNQRCQAMASKYRDERKSASYHVLVHYGVIDNEELIKLAK